MKRELSGQILRPKEFSQGAGKFTLPLGEQDRWLLRWGMIVGISLLALVLFYVALVAGEITLFQLLLGAVAVPLWMGVYVFFPVTSAAVFNGLWNAGAIGSYCGDTSPSLTYQEVVTKLVRGIHSSRLKITAFLILVLFWGYQGSTLLTTGGGHRIPLLGNLDWSQLVIAGICTLMAYVAFL